METKLVKFLILYLPIFELIGVTISIPLKDTTYRDSNTKVKRSPADNFSLFGFGLGSRFSVPITKAKESLSGLGNIFAPPTVSLQKQNVNRHSQSIAPNIVSNNRNNKPTNDELITAMPSRETSYRSEIPISMTVPGSSKNEDKNIIQQEDKNKVEEPEQKDEAPENNNEDLANKKLLDYIFQMAPDNNIDITTVDTTIEDTTGTGDYEYTTTDELLRIPGPVVATLLG